MPEVDFSLLVNGEIINPEPREFSDKRVVLFVPGAFTPTCSQAHLQAMALADKLKAKGIDGIICLSVNMYLLWGKASNAEEIIMLADGNAFTGKLDMNTGNFMA